MLNGRLRFCDALWNRYENKVCNVSITSDLITLARITRKSYKLYLEQKIIKEEKLKMDNEKKEKNKKRTGAEVKITRKESILWRNE